MLERIPQPKPESAAPIAGVVSPSVSVAEPEVAPPADVATKGRGGAAASGRASRTPAARTAKKIKGRTVYLPDDLFERVLVQAHRRDLTISDYITLLLDRHVPDHRRIVAGGPSAADSSDEAV